MSRVRLAQDDAVSYAMWLAMLLLRIAASSACASNVASHRLPSVSKCLDLRLKGAYSRCWVIFMRKVCAYGTRCYKANSGPSP